MTSTRIITIGGLVVLFSMCCPVFAAGPWSFVKSLPDATAEIRLGESLALAMDDERQRYYVVDSAHGQLASFDRQGKLLASLNPGGNLQKPVSMALAGGGRFWVVERGTNQLIYVNLQRQEVQAFSLVHPDGLPIFPEKVVVDGQNRLFVLDRSRGGVLLLDDDLKVRRAYVDDESALGFSDFCVTDDGLWALDTHRLAVTFFAEQGTSQKLVRLAGSLEFPVAFDVDSSGAFYLLDRHAGKVAVFDRSGRFSYDFLLQGKLPGQLWFPSQIMFDWAGRLCVVNEGNGRIDLYGR